MKSPFATITDRIADALRGPRSTSAELEALLNETTAARDVAAARAAELREAAIDPLLSADDAHGNRADAESADFEARRLQVAAERIGGELITAREAEAEAARVACYTEAKGARDALAKRIRADYPVIEAKLRDLVLAILENNDAVSAANADRPAGADPLNYAEGEARGFLHGEAGQIVGGQAMQIAEMTIPIMADPTGVHWPPHWSRQHFGHGYSRIDRAQLAQAPRDKLRGKAAG